MRVDLPRMACFGEWRVENPQHRENRGCRTLRFLED